MAAIVWVTLQLDDGTYTRIPAPPTVTSGASWALVSTDGVLSWTVATADFDSIVTDGGSVVVDDVTGNVVTEG